MCSVRHIGQTRRTYERGGHFGMVGHDVLRDVTLCQLNSFHHDCKLLGTVADFDDVASFQAVGRHVDTLAVHFDVAVVHELACSENRWHELGAVDERVEA